MTYNLTIEAPKDDDLIDVFKGEDKIFPNKRASYEINSQKDSLIISGQAKDITSLKALTTSIIRVLNLNKKAKEVIKNDK